ncbi:hypothetical protein HAX54_051980 [Datura stramonium]|uniref:Uncharacterized protein n=1 Tax=Datura stramonium TaxID=4076 RepID=A0ABS8WQE1_DATST|nr:hypothetical protein [Datura stramonium]
MDRTRNSGNHAPATTVVGSSVAQGRAKKVPAKKKGRPTKETPLPQAKQTEQVVQEQVPQPRPTTVPTQIVMPLETGETVLQKAYKEKSSREELKEIRTRRPGQLVGLAVQLLVEIKGCLVRGLQYLLSLRHRQVVVFLADIAKVIGASLARIRTSDSRLSESE